MSIATDRDGPVVHVVFPDRGVGVDRKSEVVIYKILTGAPEVKGIPKLELLSHFDQGVLGNTRITWQFALQ